MKGAAISVSLHFPSEDEVDPRGHRGQDWGGRSSLPPEHSRDCTPTFCTSSELKGGPVAEGPGRWLSSSCTDRGRREGARASLTGGRSQAF